MSTFTWVFFIIHCVGVGFFLAFSIWSWRAREWKYFGLFIFFMVLNVIGVISDLS